MMSSELLFEIGCEELPTRAVDLLATELAARFLELLANHQLTPSSTRVLATPRRIAVYMTGVPLEQPPTVIEKQGPIYKQAFDDQGRPTAAALGFAKSCGATVEELKEKDNRLYYKGQKPGQKTLDIVPQLASQALSQLPIPKPMRWGGHEAAFARPVHWVVLMLGSAVVPSRFFDIAATQYTYGHRYLHPEKILLREAKDYEQLLVKTGYVIPNFEDRMKLIQQAIAKTTPTGYQVDDDPDLLKEVTALVEWPVALVGHFDPHFLKVPPEVLTTSMKVNQKYFPVYKDQQLQSCFVLISNIISKDPALVIHGNEKVLNARLSDAAFFYQKDLASSLESRLLHLEHVIFQKQLGSLAHKTERIVKLAGFIASRLEFPAESALKAAQLAKCDLLTEMVGEFPSLQGVMGYYYALNDGLGEEVALALKEQYYPRFSKDQLPSSMPGKIVALADRIDTLIGIFGINQIPTGDKDPFALRRAALGLVRIIIEGKLDLDLEQLFNHAQQNYHHHLPNSNVVKQTLEFTINRLHAWYLELGFNSKQIEAVSARGITNPLDFARRLEAVEKFQRLPESASLSAANKRVSNILKKQAKIQSFKAIDPGLLEHEAEQKLAQQLQLQTNIVKQLYNQLDYTQALSQLASLKEPVDLFFDKVMVMVDDPAKRANRLALLAALHQLFTQVADISLLQ
ncbi:MAG: glycine--tRNA ligase subunit beta [Proteobacteria bacterium]|nr:glycine--tRNA ligase subunit beta [Pseudomonadota bacterium]